MFGKEVKCVSCSKNVSASSVRYTHRNGEDLPLCTECWNAAKQVFGMLRSSESKAERAKNRYLRRIG